MTPDQKMLVTDSWRRLQPVTEQAAELFYGRLFQRYPEVKSYFLGDMQEQGRKLMAMLDAAVTSLGQLESLAEPLQASGRRHATYGVQEQDYEKVADALLWTLEQLLGEAFTSEMEEAWTVAYSALADVMKAGSQRTI